MAAKKILILAGVFVRTYGVHGMPHHQQRLKRHRDP